MATYKVIQDIEAEDKFIGPLTLKQFIFASISGVLLYLSVIAFTRGAPFFLIFTMPPALIGAFLAVPWSKDQPTEVWVLAKLRFYLKPKRRVWDQSGVKEMVTITVPKKVDRHLTKDFDQNEAKSRLKALAETIDSRGWAVKNSTPGAAAGQMDFNGLSDRLVSPAANVPDFDLSSVTDIMDSSSSPVSENFDQLIQTSAQTRRDQTLEKMERIRRGEPLDAVARKQVNITPPAHSDPPAGPAAAMPPDDDDQATDNLDEQQLSQLLKKKSHRGDEIYSNLRTVPLTGAPSPTTDTPALVPEPLVPQTTSTMTTPLAPDILGLAHNDDLNVETIARQAKKSQAEHLDKNDGSEVVISLH